MIKRYLLLLLSDWAISVETGLNKKAWAEMLKTTFNFWFLGTGKKWIYVMKNLVMSVSLTPYL